MGDAGHIPAPIKVIYILGSGHSGSTLVDLVLGSHSAIESGGEFAKYIDYVAPDSGRPPEKRMCTCGVSIDACSYWQTVRARLHKEHGTDLLDTKADDPVEFEAANASVIGALLATAGKAFFCDSSKLADRCMKMIASDRFDVWVVHLVRDGRAVGYSYKRKYGTFLPEVWRWGASNSRLGTRLGHQLGERYLPMRYEDFSADPRGETERVLTALGLTFEEAQLAFREQVHHNLAGNRMRRQADSQIRCDTDYLEELSAWEWCAGSLLAGRALRRFGYDRARKRARVNA